MDAPPRWGGWWGSAGLAAAAWCAPPRGNGCPVRAGKGPTTPKRANLLAPRTADLPPMAWRTTGSWQARHPRLWTAKLKEIIVVEVDWIGTMMVSPRNPDRRPLQRERAFFGQVNSPSLPGPQLSDIPTSGESRVGALQIPYSQRASQSCDFVSRPEVNPVRPGRGSPRGSHRRRTRRMGSWCWTRRATIDVPIGRRDIIHTRDCIPADRQDLRSPV